VKLITTAVFLLACLLSRASAQTAAPPAKPEGSAGQQVAELQRQWVAAIKDQDDKRISQLQDDGFFLAVGVQGRPLQIVPRGRWLENLKFYKIHSHNIDDMKVSVYGDTAVVLMLYTQQATVGRTPTDRSAQFLITDIWVKRKGGWRVAERHSSRPEQPPAPRPTP
jgi:ketosteroid isomerase-like protein